MELVDGGRSTGGVASISRLEAVANGSEGFRRAILGFEPLSNGVVQLGSTGGRYEDVEGS